MRADIRVGDIFENKYQILELIGSGGVGTVYKARQLDFDRLLVIKVLQTRSAQDPEFCARFIREAKVLSELSHPNVVTIYSRGLTEAGIPYLAMELVEGKSVRSLLNESSKLPGLRALKIIEEAARALAYVHKHGVIHRDLKPENILLADKPDPDTVKLIDFGLARQEEAASEGLTKTGLLIGTPDYMSPEQCQGKKAGVASDIYSLGVCLYEMLAGEKLFAADSPIGVLYKHINEPVPDLVSKDLEDYSPELNSILKRALAKTESDRYAIAEDFAEAIAGLVKSMESLGEARSPKRVPSGVRLLLVLSISLLVLGLSLFFLSEKRAKNPEELVEAASKLPKQKSYDLLLEQLKKQLQDGRELEALSLLKQALGSKELCSVWGPGQTSSFCSAGFENWQKFGKRKTRACAVLTLLELFREAKNSLSKGQPISSTNEKGLDEVSKYLIENPPDKEGWTKIYETLKVRLSASEPLYNSLPSEYLSFLQAESVLRLSNVVDPVEEANQHLILAGEKALAKNNLDLARQAANRALKLSSSLRRHSVDAHRILSDCFARSNDFAAARKELLEGEKVADANTSPLGLWVLYRVTMDLCIRQNDWSSYYTYIGKARSLAAENSDVKSGLQVYLLQYYLHKGEIAAARKQLLEALSLNNSVSGPSGKGDFFFLEILRFRDITDYPDFYFELCKRYREESVKSGAPDCIVRSSSLLAKALRLYPQCAGTAAYEQAGLILIDAEKVSARVRDFWILRDFYSECIEHAHQIDDLENWQQYSMKLLDLSSTNKMSSQVRDARRDLFRCQLRRNNPDAAWKQITDGQNQLADEPAELSYFYFDCSRSAELRDYPSTMHDICRLNLDYAAKYCWPAQQVRSKAMMAKYFRINCGTGPKKSEALMQAEALLSEANLLAAKVDDFWALKDLSDESISFARQKGDMNKLYGYSNKLLALSERNDGFWIKREAYIHLLDYYLNVYDGRAAWKLVSEARSKLKDCPAELALFYLGAGRLELLSSHPALYHELCKLNQELAATGGRADWKVRADCMMARYLRKSLPDKSAKERDAMLKNAEQLLSRANKLAENVFDQGILHDLYEEGTCVANATKRNDMFLFYSQRLLNLADLYKSVWITREAYTHLFRYYLRMSHPEEVRKLLVAAQERLSKSRNELCFFYLDTSCSGETLGYPALRLELCNLSKEASDKSGLASDIIVADLAMSRYMAFQSLVFKNQVELRKEAEKLLEEANKLTGSKDVDSWRIQELQKDLISLAILSHDRDKLAKYKTRFLNPPLEETSGFYRELLRHLLCVYLDVGELEAARQELQDARRVLKGEKAQLCSLYHDIMQSREIQQHPEFKAQLQKPYDELELAWQRPRE